jgi:hypothetical protein
MLPFQALGQAAVLAGTLVLVLALVALGAFAYRQVVGDGVEWPDDEAADGAERGDSSDEWKYY